MQELRFETIEYVNPALRYIFLNHDNISGIICAAVDESGVTALGLLYDSA